MKLVEQPGNSAWHDALFKILERQDFLIGKFFKKDSVVISKCTNFFIIFADFSSYVFYNNKVIVHV